ncbi:EAL domain-containing protein (putative c-di-GMP-specific phosphodiesterase class I) [Marinobacterium mangrovicola]|uniref:EAL domain-containing protein (Putative c-di-GMP-specific phosphodiesterase class I) n=2 Tax=Marinobacterium mangrovicola TaxID=1476959 RepID=A0A4R1GK76_9GAMM|nr:EAL domain-containing protein (putative c-di-GMP-specific phosphodiesterase class I) [Marinobacterium mangrovicola]
MLEQANFRKLGCAECANATCLSFDFTMAFQPIVNIRTRSIYSQEALVRGLDNQPAGVVFESVNESNRYAFDQACRVKAIQLAAELGVDSFLNINFLPTAVYRPELCIRTTLAAAEQYGFPAEKIIFEFTEVDQVDSPEHLLDIVEHYRHLGFKTAIDDFGAGYSGLNMLADTPTDLIKLDMALIRNIDRDKTRQVIVRGIVGICNELGIQVIAEGVETAQEVKALAEEGIELMQGYYFARPSFRSLATIDENKYTV